MIDQHAEIMVLRDEDALVAHGPAEDIRISHVRICIANEDRIMTGFGQELSDAAPYIVINEEFHAGFG